MSAMDRGMGAALGFVRRLGGLDLLDRLGIRESVERVVFNATKNGFQAAGAASRNFAKAAQSLPTAKRQSPRTPAPLFDLTPEDEQQMLQEAFRAFVDEQVRPAALAADAASASPDEVLATSRELGTMMLGVPAELGGVVDERSSITSVLAMEALAHGDMGIATAAFAPAGVATALALWGDAGQQGRYLPSLLGEDPPAAAVAVHEHRPLFDPFDLRTTARRSGGGYVLNGTKSMVPLVASAELLLVAARLEGTGPALFLVESGTPGVRVELEPTMGVRAAATGHLHLEAVNVGDDALLAEGDPAVYAEAIHRARLAWCAMAVGTGQAVLDYVIPYVNERHAFGEPISHRQAVAFTVSDIAIELEGMRLTTLRAASLADQGKPFGEATAIARQLCATKGMAIGSHGVQLLGGHGYVKEHPVERWYRDLRGAGLVEGGLVA